jgi:hypothetical protein
MSSSTIPANVRLLVLRRDGFRCIAPQVDLHAGWCKDTWGHVITRWTDRDPGPQYLTMSHTKEDGELMMGKKTTPEEMHLVSLCPFHHQGFTAGSNWEAVHRNDIRTYLKGIYGRETRR